MYGYYLVVKVVAGKAFESEVCKWWRLNSLHIRSVVDHKSGDVLASAVLSFNNIAHCN
jgi:hypothetical protein